jgi:hypothetical protein
MKFNPFAENKPPSRSMFAKKEPSKAPQAPAELIADLEEAFGIHEFLGKEMRKETFTFFKELSEQIGEEKTKAILTLTETVLSDSGDLTKLHCNGDDGILSLQKLPNKLVNA